MDKKFPFRKSSTSKSQWYFIIYCNVPGWSPTRLCISPILFNTHIDDLEDGLPEQLKVSTDKYADDCTQHQIVSVDTRGMHRIGLDVYNPTIG